jgi:hypothetical protein
MPNFDERAFRLSIEPLELEPVVVKQLRNFVDVVCSMYHDNPFHNFEHASHVAMSVTKLLSRIVAPRFSGANIRNSTKIWESFVLMVASLEAMNWKQLKVKIDPSQTMLGPRIQQLFQDQAQLHDHTYGITSDPLTQFAVVLSALVHDVDHGGVPNFLLVKENEALASFITTRVWQSRTRLTWRGTVSWPPSLMLCAPVFTAICPNCVDFVKLWSIR